VRPPTLPERLSPRELENARPVPAALVEHLDVADDGDVSLLPRLGLVVVPAVRVNARVRDAVDLAFDGSKEIAVRRVPREPVGVHVALNQLANLDLEGLCAVVPIALPHPHEAEDDPRREAVRQPMLAGVQTRKAALPIRGQRDLEDAARVARQEGERELDEVHLVEGDVVDGCLSFLEDDERFIVVGAG
jgi:hypothetical protein